MLDQLLRERLNKNEYRTFNVLLIVAALWLLYGMFDHSGIVGWLQYLQAEYLLNGRYYPMLSFLIGFVFVMYSMMGVFLFYARFKPKPKQ